MWSSHRQCLQALYPSARKSTNQLHLEVQGKSHAERKGSQETWCAQGESLDGINANRPGTSWLLNIAWISAFQQLGNDSLFATIFQIWSNRFNMTEPKYASLKGNSRDRKTKQTNKQKTPRVLMTDSAGGRESQDIWSNFAKCEREPPSTPSQDSLFGAYNSAKKQKHKENPQQDSKDYCWGFWRLYHGDRKELEAADEQEQARPSAKWPSPVSCPRVAQRLTWANHTFMNDNTNTS